jgi:transcriptional regulator with XRE-family HTH domain
MNRLPASPLITRALTIAEQRLGMDELAARLGATSDTIRIWRNGHASMPERKFLKLIDIITDLDVDWQAPPEA